MINPTNLVAARRMARTLGVSTLALALAAPAFAQDTTTQDSDPTTLPVVESTEASTEPGIVVTGSRIRRDESMSPAPIQFIDPALAMRQGKVDTAEMIQSSSIAAGSSQITSAISSAGVTNGGQGASTISLRGLGAERTLVLLNGRRAGPAGTRGGVASFDLNVLPQSIVQSVEIVKDGASSVYGSDAVAGVVNLLTKRGTDGLQLDGFVSRPFKKGGETQQLAATWGKDFGTGHFMAAIDYYKRSELKKGQRSYLRCEEDYIFTESGERADLTDPRGGVNNGPYKCNDTLWGHLWLYDYSYIYSTNPSNTVAPNGRTIQRLQYSYGNDNLGAYIPGLTPAQDPYQLSAGPGWYPVGYDRASAAVENTYHPAIGQSTVIPRTERITAYFDGSIDLTDGIRLYGELIHNQRTTRQTDYRQFWQFGFTSDSNLPLIFFGDPSRGDPYASAVTGDYLISPTVGTTYETSQRVNYTRGVLGLGGDLGGALDGWSWDTYGQYSHSFGTYDTQQIYADSIATQDFRTGDCSGTVTAIRGARCLNIDWTNPAFLAGEFTQEQRDFLFGRERGRTTYDQFVWEATVSGSPITLPAGDVGIALGLAYRTDKINDRPGHITYAFDPSLGLDPGDPDAYINNAWGFTGAGITAGKSATKEAFGEIEVPLIHDTPFIQRLTLAGAARVTNVKATRKSDGFSAKDNNNWTYKGSINWEVTDWLRLRGTYGTSYRAPALFEQFLADQTSFLAQRQVDPCIRWATNLAAGTISQRIADNCAADGVPGTYTGGSTTATIITGGGIGVLKPETSTSKTASIILTPRLGADTNFSLVVDYFDIKVKGEIAKLGAGSIVQGCYDSEFFPTDPLCDLFVRGQTAAPLSIDTVRDSFLNVNSQRNKGIDFTARLRQRFGAWGTLSLVAQATHQLKDTVALFEGTETSSNGEDGEPKWVGDIKANLEVGSWNFFYGVDYVGPTSDEGDYIDANDDLCQDSIIYGRYCVDLRAERRFYHSASISKSFADDRFRITAGVTNFTNTKPPRVSGLNGGEISTLGYGVFSSQYDLVGRRAFLNVSAKF